MISTRYQRRLSLAGLDVASLSPDELRGLVSEILSAKIHGVSFSPYVDDQGPGHVVSRAQIRDRLSVIAPHVRWVRTFSCTSGNEHIPELAHAAGLKTLVGIWLDDDQARNQREINAAIRLARAGHVNLMAVGNEVLLREELSEDQLLDYLSVVKHALPGLPVGYVDAYFQFEDHPRVAEACDVLFVNCYPFWEGCPAEHSLLYMKEMYRRAEKVADGKPVVVSETGWPNRGTAFEGAVPSWNSAIKYFVDTCQWAEEEEREIFYFSAFDEGWKVGVEGDVGACWGLWDSQGRPKYC